jgi:hypothetical protein
MSWQPPEPGGGHGTTTLTRKVGTDARSLGAVCEVIERDNDAAAFRMSISEESAGGEVASAPVRN